MAKERGDNLKSNRLPQFLCSKLLGGTLSTGFTPFSLQTTDAVGEGVSRASGTVRGAFSFPPRFRYQTDTTVAVSQILLADTGMLIR